MKKIAYSKNSLKTLRRMQRSQSKAIVDKIEDYAANLPVDTKPLKGSDYVRIRVGQWRIIVDDDGLVLNIIKIAPRGDVYKRR